MDLPPDVLDLIIGLGILIGAIQCFFGYRIFKVVLGLTGFILGGALGVGTGFAIFQEETIALVAGLVGGVIGAVFLMALYVIGVFLLGAVLGGVVGTALFAVAESHPEPAVLLILAVIAGILALIFQKFMIIVSTGLGGAWHVVTGIAYFTTGLVDPTNVERLFRSGGISLYAVLLCWLALGIIGVASQFKSGLGTDKSMQPTGVQ